MPAKVTVRQHHPQSPVILATISHANNPKSQQCHAARVSKRHKHPSMKQALSRKDTPLASPFYLHGLLALAPPISTLSNSISHSSISLNFLAAASSSLLFVFSLISLVSTTSSSPSLSPPLLTYIDASASWFSLSLDRRPYVRLRRFLPGLSFAAAALGCFLPRTVLSDVLAVTFFLPLPFVAAGGR